MEKQVGTVKWFDTEKGYGFIGNHSNPDEDVFVHYRSIEGGGFKNLKEGQQVEFYQMLSAKGFQAAEVSVIESAELCDA